MRMNHWCPRNEGWRERHQRNEGGDKPVALVAALDVEVANGG
jgi:hypothetical protein